MKTTPTHSNSMAHSTVYYNLNFIRDNPAMVGFIRWGARRSCLLCLELTGPRLQSLDVVSACSDEALKYRSKSCLHASSVASVAGDLAVLRLA